VTFAGDASFYDCDALNTIGNGVTFAGNAIFEGCTALTAIGAGVTFAGWACFHGCTALNGAQHGCGEHNRTIYAVIGKDGVSRAKFGCQNLTRAEAIAAISEKYGDTSESAEYIAKVNAAFDYAEAHRGKSPKNL